MASIARILLTGMAAVLLAAVPLHAGNNDPAPKLNRISIKRTMSKASDYVDKYAEAAMEQMRRYGIPASVTLAQGILESASGQSELSRKGNNHFGIKATKTWLEGGGRYLVYTDDKPNEKFCQYASVADSYEHHSLFLRGNKRYSNLFELSPDDYVGWTRGLQEDGYASSKQYASSLQSLIKQHGLDRYDRQVMQEQGWQSTLAPTTSTTDLAAHSDSGTDRRGETPGAAGAREEGGTKGQGLLQHRYRRAGSVEELLRAARSGWGLPFRRSHRRAGQHALRLPDGDGHPDRQHGERAAAAAGSPRTAGLGLPGEQPRLAELRECDEQHEQQSNKTYKIMIKSKVTVIGTVTRSADIKNGRDGQLFISFGMRVRLGDGDDAADIDISVAYDGDDEDALFTNKEDRVKVQGVMTFKKMGDQTYYNLSAEKIKHDVTEADAISGTLEFRGTVGAKGVVQHQGKKGAFRHFDAYSAEKVGDDQYSYVWVHFVDFGDDQRIWMGPKTKIKAQGALELQVYKERLSINCRVDQVSKWVKDESK